MQVERGLLGVHSGILEGDVVGLDQACADAVRDGLDQLPLCRLLSVVDTKDVLLLRRGLKDLLDHASKVLHVNGGEVVLAFADAAGADAGKGGTAAAGPPLFGSTE